MKSGKRYKFKNYEFWAEDGTIAILDLNQAGSTEESVKSATKHVPLGEFVRNAAAAASLQSVFDRHQARKLLNDALECIAEAKKQGDMSDPKVLADKIQSRRKIQISMAHSPLSVVTSNFSSDGFLGPSGMEFMNTLRNLRTKSVDAGKVLFEGYSTYVEPFKD